MRREILRTDIEPQIIQSNGCTNPIRIHPIIGDVIGMRNERCEWVDGAYKTVIDAPVSLIKLDGRQWWTCYYYDVGEHGWNCERDNVALRLTEKVFNRYFGKITVIGNGNEKYHEEGEM